MRPLTAVNLLVLGSCFAIAFSLAAVLIVFLVLGDEYPRLQHEFGPLVQSFLVFLIMTALSAASFYTLVKLHPWWRQAQAVMWLGVVATGCFYWP